MFEIFHCENKTQLPQLPGYVVVVGEVSVKQNIQTQFASKIQILLLAYDAQDHITQYELLFGNRRVQVMESVDL